PCEIDFAVDCFIKAAAGGHPNAKSHSFWLEKADDTSFGTNALSMFASKLPPDEPNHILMMVGCRLYSALCQRYEAIDGVIKYELDAASKSDYPFIQEFVKRTGLSRSFYDGGLDMLTEGSAADQITDGLNSLYFALINSGHNELHCLFIRCTIVGYIISKSKHSNLSKPLLGIDKFFS
ncbi:MAG: hypothetical protein Q8J78_12525, partial [Moraxellaceae bacterium]|nr:hypothetical protein [Moraxellaceae bacterium]